MFLPFDIGEIHGIAELIYKVIEVGWSNVHNAHQQYIEFRQDVEALKEQLETLQLAINISRARTGALLAPRQPAHIPRQLEDIFSNFKETLEDCRRLLESQSRYATPSGPVSNMQWFLLVKDEVDMHRDRIAVLNSKLSLVLQSLQIETSNDQTVLILECTNLLLEKMDWLAKMLGWPLPQEAPRRIDIPQPLGNLLESITTARYGSLTAIPMSQAVEEIIFYLDRATRWHERRRSTDLSCRESKFVNILRAYWLLTITKATDEYQAATSAVNMALFEQQFPQLGMTVRRFFSKLEDRIFDAHAQLTRSGEQTPPIARLPAVLEQEQNAWQEHNEWRPQHDNEEDNPRRGDRVATCRLQNSNTATGQLLEIYQPDRDQPHLTVITCGLGRPDRVHDVDLECLHLAPSTVAATLKGSLYSVNLSPVRGRSQGGFKLAVKEPEDLFEFQEWMTGYKVVDDFPGTVVTSQRAHTLIGGERRIDTGRVQLWSSTRLSTGSQLPEEFLDKDFQTRTLRNIEPRIVSPHAPVLDPLASFSRLTLSSEPATAETASNSSVYLDTQTAPQPRARTLSLTRTLTITSFTSSQSSTASGLDTTKRPANIIKVDKRGNEGCILDQPDPPRLVLFLPPRESGKPGPKGSAAGSATLLVIDIDQYVRTNPALCDCQQDHLTTGQGQGQGQSRMVSLDTNPAPPGTQVLSPRQASAAQQQRQCRRVILEVVGVSGITAKETDSGADGPWNLAGAGRYQSGEGMVGVKRLKKVGLEFAGVEERVRFVEYFTTLRRLYLLDLRATRR